jgi:DeoR family fructose operon transcriptional repressor
MKPQNRATPAGEGTAPLYAEERQRAIVRLLDRRGRIGVTAVAEELGVTTETIRRDLTALERAGVLRRVHGGAIPVESLGFEPRLSVRQEAHTDEKERIAKRVLDELPAEGTVVLDAGSTLQRVAELLPHDRELTVVTNSLGVAQTVAQRDNLTLFYVGGRVRGRTLAAVGNWALTCLRDCSVDLAVLGTNGISVRRGLTTPDQDEAAVKRAMAEAARRVVVACDHTKFGADHFAQFAPLSLVDTVITDTGLDEDTAAEVTAAGPDVVLA